MGQRLIIYSVYILFNIYYNSQLCANKQNKFCSKTVKKNKQNKIFCKLKDCTERIMKNVSILRYILFNLCVRAVNFYRLFCNKKKTVKKSLYQSYLVKRILLITFFCIIIYFLIAGLLRISTSTPSNPKIRLMRFSIVIFPDF